jgi:hypothetical protein
VIYGEVYANTPCLTGKWRVTLLRVTWTNKQGKCTVEIVSTRKKRRKQRLVGARLIQIENNFKTIRREGKIRLTFLKIVICTGTGVRMRSRIAILKESGRHLKKRNDANERKKKKYKQTQQEY